MKRVLPEGNTRALYLCCALLLLLWGGQAFAEETAAGSADGQVKVPVVISLAKAVAGAQFQFSYTEGLTFVAFEQAEALQSALVTPAAEREGGTYIGFFAGDNICVPDENGELFAGYLVFRHGGGDAQSVTVTEAKLVEIVDGATNSEVRSIGKTIAVSLDTPAPAIDIPLSPVPLAQVAGSTTPGVHLVWVILASAATGAAVFLIMKRRRPPAQSVPAGKPDSFINAP